jgi:hypothetical protein
VDVHTLPDGHLIAIVLGGEDESNWDACQQELTKRCVDGNLGCQRASIAILSKLFGAGKLSPLGFLARAEPVAWMAAAKGNDTDLSTLAGIIAVRADYLRELGVSDFARASEAETLALLGTVANESTDDRAAHAAALAFNELAASFSADAVEDAKTGLLSDFYLNTEQKDEPEVAAFKRAKEAKE